MAIIMYDTLTPLHIVLLDGFVKLVGSVPCNTTHCSLHLNAEAEEYIYI